MSFLEFRLIQRIGVTISNEAFTGLPGERFVNLFHGIELIHIHR
jgi:hypothetical protein